MQRIRQLNHQFFRRQRQGYHDDTTMQIALYNMLAALDHGDEDDISYIVSEIGLDGRHAYYESDDGNGEADDSDYDYDSECSND